MSRKEKLIARFKGQPSDFTWEEMVTLLGIFGFQQEQGAGSRVKFIDQAGRKILLHKPHPGNIVKHYVIKQVSDYLMEHGTNG